MSSSMAVVRELPFSVDSIKEPSLTGLVQLEIQINEKNHELMTLIQQLSELQGQKSLQKEIIAMIQQRLEEYETLVDSYSLSVDDVVVKSDVKSDSLAAEESPSSSKRPLVVLDRFKENIKLLKRRFRKAQISSNDNIHQQWLQQRRELFALNSVESSGSNKKAKSGNSGTSATSDDLLMAKSDEISGMLRQLHQLAQAEVTKSELNIEEIDLSTKKLEELGQKYSAFDVLLTGSRLLVKHLEEADKWDRLYMLASLGFLAVVLTWIIWRRILKGPVMLLVWSLTRTLGLFGGAARLVGKHSGGSEMGSSVSFDTLLESSLVSQQTKDVVSGAISSVVSQVLNSTATLSSELSASSLPSTEAIVHSEL